MTRLYARFRIPVKKWRDSNQRLNPVVAGIRSSWIVDETEKTWRSAVKHQFNLEPIEPTDDDIRKHLKAAKIQPTESYQADLDRMQDRLTALQALLAEWDDKNKTELERLKRKKNKTDADASRLALLSSERNDLKDRVSRQSKSTTTARQSLHKILDKNNRENMKAWHRALLKARKDLNKDNRLFKDKVRFHVCIHNITKHLYDAPNAYPTVKPLEDAGTNTGILWLDDNNECIPLTTFQGGGMLERDNYVIDVIVETIDEPLMADPFTDFESHLNQ